MTMGVGVAGVAAGRVREGVPVRGGGAATEAFSF